VELRELSPVADVATRTYEARFTMPADAEAALGMSATVTLAQAARRPTVALPSSALIDTGSGPSVWVVGADDRLEARPVVVESYAAGSVRITSGLAGGERVVVLGAHRLQAGAPVRALAAGS
jgi:multidrug efflux pump subunit AcrA (membrane-fusion protein)